MSTRTGVALLVWLAICGCEQDVRAPFDLDQIEDWDGDCVAVLRERLEVGLELHEYVADSSSSRGGWALATMLDDSNQPTPAIVRVPAERERATKPIALSLQGGSIELRPGARPGELWVLQKSKANTWLGKIEPSTGVTAGNPSIANFPVVDDISNCQSQFHRQLLLIEGRPFVLALPACSDSTKLELQLLELDPDTLVFASAWQLTFDPCATDPECGLYPYALTPIRGGESTHSPNAKQVSVGFSQVRDYGNGLTSAGVSLLELEKNGDAPSARLITFREVWFTPTDLGPVQLGEDLSSVLLHVRNGGSDHDAALLRFDVFGQLFLQIKSPNLPLAGRGRLIQLETESAMIDVDDGKLVAVPLDDVASWPDWQPQTLLELDDLIGFEPAGIGQLLLRREHAPAQVVQLRCSKQSPK